jgi:signal transduction histidine kinase
MDRGFRRPFLLLDELTEELHKTEKAAYGKLIRLMSHEVNNTCGAVNSLLQSCLTYRDQIGETDRQDFAGAVEVAMTRNSHLNEFMRGFADVIRLPEPRRQPCELRPMLERIVVLLGARAELAAIDWQWEIDREPPPIDMDAGQMEQALLNVMGNAIEAIESRRAGEPALDRPARGTITIHIGRERDRPLVAIRDSGTGITPAIQEQLFTPFFTTRSDGQGIGLTLVQEILVAHGFDFTLENRADGGAEFIIRF